ncbi:30S ribosomal protein S12 methylthiotransferase RimO [bacterium]|nr:30S ribosomal protein S12 methylthiotransferase RimO [bacterium]
MYRKNAKIFIANLGCPKNEVDGEVWIGKLTAAGFEITHNPQEADFLFVNSCAFIEDARRESADVIRQLGRIKQKNGSKKLFITGCWAQKEGKKLLEKFPFVDGVLGNLDIESACRHLINNLNSDNKLLYVPDTPGMWYPVGEILPQTYPYAYIKIADGCNNFCSYCILPQIKHRFRSTPIEHIIDRAKFLVEHNYKELVLVAQETSRYGQDLGNEINLITLLEKLNQIDGDFIIRVLYLHPIRVTRELIDAIASLPKVTNYLDIPLQHYDSDILSAMNRGYDSDYIEKMLEMIKSSGVEFTLRTTFITGFPGETDQQFENLLNFVSRGEFTHMGVFQYSPEPGTPAAEMPNRVPPEIASLRKELLEMTQDQISFDRNRALENKVTSALVESHTLREDVSIARMEQDAPEIDRHIRVQGLKPVGEWIRVRIIKALPHEFLGIMEE